MLLHFFHSAYSNELNQSRLSVLKTREECVQKILTEALDQLGSVSQPGPEYEALLKKLLIQVGSKKTKKKNLDIY